MNFHSAKNFVFYALHTDTGWAFPFSRLHAAVYHFCNPVINIRQRFLGLTALHTIFGGVFHGATNSPEKHPRGGMRQICEKADTILSSGYSHTLFLSKKTDFVLRAHLYIPIIT